MPMGLERLAGTVIGLDAAASEAAAPDKPTDPKHSTFRSVILCRRLKVPGTAVGGMYHAHTLCCVV